MFKRKDKPSAMLTMGDNSRMIEAAATAIKVVLAAGKTEPERIAALQCLSELASSKANYTVQNCTFTA